MSYAKITIQCAPEWTEILIAELSQAPYESFMETEQGFEAYCPQAQFEVQILEELSKNYPQTPIKYQIETLEKQNWNETWEQNYPPIFIANQIFVGASFHTKPEKKLPYTIEINPKMSFGTGHHATTALMLETMLSLDCQTKKVLDAGSGTGILAIMAEKMGAKSTIGIDIEEWAVENATENALLNQCQHTQFMLGTVTTCIEKNELFDIILANINRNVLIDEMEYYHQHLKKEGNLLLSGFYQEDIPILEQHLQKIHPYQKITQHIADNWAVLSFKKL